MKLRYNNADVCIAVLVLVFRIVMLLITTTHKLQLRMSVLQMKSRWWVRGVSTKVGNFMTIHENFFWHFSLHQNITHKYVTLIITKVSLSIAQLTLDLTSFVFRVSEPKLYKWRLVEAVPTIPCCLQCGWWHSRGESCWSEAARDVRLRNVRLDWEHRGQAEN